MTMLLGKDNGLANTLSALYPEARLHQVLQHLSDGILIIDIAVYLVAFDVPMIVRILVQRLASLFVRPHRFHLFLLFPAQLIVADALLQYHRAPFQGIVWHQESIRHRFIQFVSKGVRSIHLEEVERVLLHFFPWGGSQAYQESVEVIEDSGVLTEHRTVSLIDDNQIEATDGERLLLAVDVVDHGLIRTEQDAGIHVRLPFIAQDARAFIREQFGIVLRCLTNQGRTVGQEKHVLHPVVPFQYLGQ